MKGFEGSGLVPYLYGICCDLLLISFCAARQAAFLSLPVALEVVPGHAVHLCRRVEVSHDERTVRQETNLALDAVEPGASRSVCP